MHRKTFTTKMRVTGLVFEIDAIGGKMSAKFVPMKQNSVALIYDLNTMTGTTESYLKKMAQPYKTVQFQI